MIWLIVSFLIIAIVYASVGFGGGSSYIALLLAAGMVVEEVRFLALVCNVLVVTGSVIQYYRSQLIDWSLMMPLIIASVPLAYWGGTIALSTPIYKMIAGSLLLIASILLIARDQISQSSQKMDVKMWQLTSIGGAIGFMSGLIGIGGGIFLAPLLHLIRWQPAKIISAAASLFILVNSVAGLLGQLSNGPSIDLHHLLPLAIAVLIGGRIGNHLNIKVLKPSYIRSLTAVLIAVVGIRLLIQNV